ncbi:hypothetical protein F5884DRAFT_853608 [Xylogone sp. PMI_703]|nr:hypothetical protein F5884DRAFT_853608 [Xylogone sp. PMI_703]
MTHTHIFDSWLSLLGFGGARENSHCIKRSDTRRQDVFDLLRPYPVSIDFSKGNQQSFDVTIPAQSQWSSVRIFHLDTANCVAVKTLSGRSWVMWENIERGSGSTMANAGYSLSQYPRQYLTWGSQERSIEQSLRVTTAAAPDNNINVQLYRTLCSVVQDAQLYFSLCSTPLWIRLLYAALGLIPYYGRAAKERLILIMLYVQLRVIFYKNDCWTDQGQIRIDWYWWTAPPWVWKFQAWTTIVISQGTLRLLYGIGRVILGMKESYTEYNVLPNSMEF